MYEGPWLDIYVISVVMSLIDFIMDVNQVTFLLKQQSIHRIQSS